MTSGPLGTKEANSTPKDVEFDKWYAGVQDKLSGLPPEEALKIAFQAGLTMALASADQMLPAMFEFGARFNIAIGATENGYMAVSRNFKITGPSAIGCVLQLASAEAGKVSEAKPSLILPTK